MSFPMSIVHYRFIQLSFGTVGILWHLDDRPRLIEVVLQDNHLLTLDRIRQSFPDATERSHDKIDNICRQLEWYDQGQEQTFSFEDLLFDYGSTFYRAVWEETSRIPFGKVATYGRVAANIFAPRAARAVGTALARNPFPLLIPCHRVVKSTGALGGFSSGGAARKRQLLEKEGVGFDQWGRVRRLSSIG